MTFPTRLLVPALLACLAWPAAGRAAESYDACTGFIDAVPHVVTTPGTWCLRGDLATAQSSGHAISVQSGNVTIDCNDYKLGGLLAGDATNAIGIHANNMPNVTVRNCNIRGFRYGLMLLGSTPRGLLVEDNRFDGNINHAMYLHGTGTIARRNRVFDTGGGPGTNMARGMHLVGTQCVVADNSVWGVFSAAPAGFAASAHGIRIDGPRCMVTGNRVSAVLGAGGGETVAIYTDDLRVLVRDNQVAGDTGTGVVCLGSNSTAQRNLIQDFPTAVSGCLGNTNLYAP